MDEFAPLLLVLIFWVIIGIPAAAAKKTAAQKKQAAARFPARNAQESADQPAAPQQPSKPAERLTTLVPAVYEPDHDDSVFTGSLGPVETEGFDPCHENQLQDMEIVCEPGKETPAPQVRSGLALGWTGNDIVKGIVMSEILNRKR